MSYNCLVKDISYQRGLFPSPGPLWWQGVTCCGVGWGWGSWLPEVACRFAGGGCGKCGCGLFPVLKEVI